VSAEKVQKGFKRSFGNGQEKGTKSAQFKLNLRKKEVQEAGKIGKLGISVLGVAHAVYATRRNGKPKI